MSRAALVGGLLLTLAPSAEMDHACAPVPGSNELWSKPGLRFVIVGEIHGTKETPAAFLDVICSAQTLKRPIVVGIERPSSEQPAIDAFLTARDHAAAKRALLSEPGWNVFDGRSSLAMLDLLEQLRALKIKGSISEIVAFDDARSGESSAQRDARMASSLMAAAERHKDALVIVLTGNLHASKQSMPRFGDYPFMAMLLPPAKTISLIVHDLGGEAWTQSNDGCGPHRIKSSGGDRRGVFLSDGGPPMPGYDGVLSTGLPSTASSPAIDDPPPPPACGKN